MTFEIFDQSDEGTWPDQQKYNNKYNCKDRKNDKHNDKDNPRDLWPLRHLIRVMRGHDLTNKNKMTKTNTKTKTMTATVIKTIPKTCDIWDTNYNFDNWELEFITIFVAWQLRVTLDCLKKSQNNSKSSSHNEYLFKCTFQDQIILAVFFGGHIWHYLLTWLHTWNRKHYLPGEILEQTNPTPCKIETEIWDFSPVRRDSYFWASSS